MAQKSLKTPYLNGFHIVSVISVIFLFNHKTFTV